MKDKKDTLRPDKIRAMSDEEIAIELQRQRGQLYTFRTQAVTDKIEDPSRYSKARKNIARLLSERTARTAKAASK